MWRLPRRWRAAERPHSRPPPAPHARGALDPAAVQVKIELWMSGKTLEMEFEPDTKVAEAKSRILESQDVVKHGILVNRATKKIMRVRDGVPCPGAR